MRYTPLLGAIVGLAFVTLIAYAAGSPPRFHMDLSVSGPVTEPQDALHDHSDMGHFTSGDALLIIQRGQFGCKPGQHRSIFIKIKEPDFNAWEGCATVDGSTTPPTAHIQMESGQTLTLKGTQETNL